MRYFITICVTFILSVNLGYSQKTDNQLAYEYYRNQDYEKAAVLFKKLYKERKSSYYRNYYIQSLVHINDFDEVEDFIKKELRKDKDNVELKVDLGFIYKNQGKDKKAESLFRESIEEATRAEALVKTVANSFVRKRMFEQATATYAYARDNMQSDFHYEMANLYYLQRKFENMIEEYLDLLKDDPSYIDNVQNRLQIADQNDIDGNLNKHLEQKVLLRVQSQPKVKVYSELLIWHYIQTGDYERAYLQASALDRRTNGKGKEVLDLGKLAYKNEQYDVAVKCFKYIFELGKSSPFFYHARNEYLASMYQKLTHSDDTPRSELESFEKELTEVIENTPRKLALQIVRLRANIRAFHLHKIEAAISEVRKVLDSYQLSPNDAAEYRLLLGDLLLLSGDPWEAILIYAKVENDNKNNPYGSEAKYRKARLAYFTGQFEWAQAQLDVLKASTSKLIANDASDLSLFITENSDEDSLQRALKIFARADMLEFQNKDSLAVLSLDSIESKFPDTKLRDDVLSRRAKIFRKHGQYEDAAEAYRKIAEQYPEEILSDNAMMALGELYLLHLNKKEKAAEVYKNLLLTHPGSIFTTEARKKMRSIQPRASNPEQDD